MTWGMVLIWSAFAALGLRMWTLGECCDRMAERDRIPYRRWAAFWLLIAILLGSTGLATFIIGEKKFDTHMGVVHQH